MVAVYRRLAEARANLKNSLVHEGETHLFTPLMESWEIILVEDLLSLVMKRAVFC